MILTHRPQKLRINGGKREWGLAALLVAVLIGGALALRQSRSPALPIPIPPNVKALEPQLQALIAEKAEWIRASPGKFERHATLALIYAVNNLWPEAELAFGNAAKLAPQEPLALMYLGVSAQEQGRVDQGLAILQTVTQKFPDFPPAFYRLAEAHLKAGNLEEAEKAFARLTQLSPAEWRGWAGLGEIQLDRKNETAAMELLRKAIQIDPTAKKAHYLLGMACRRAGRMEEAAFELALGQNHIDFPMTDSWNDGANQFMKTIGDQIQIAREMQEHGKAAEAVKLLREALRFQPENITLLNNLAISLISAEQPALALEPLQKLTAANSNYLPAWVSLAQAYHGLGRTNEALAAADRAIAMAPESIKAHLAKVNALLGMEADTAALAELEKAAELDPKNEKLQVEMGDVFWGNLNAPQKALEHYQKALELNQVSFGARLKMGQLLESMGESEKARSNFFLAKKIAAVEGIALEPSAFETANSK